MQPLEQAYTVLGGWILERGFTRDQRLGINDGVLKDTIMRPVI